MEKKRNHTWWKTTWNSLKLYCSPKHWPWTAATGHQGELRLFEISSSAWKRKLWKAFCMAGRLGDIQKIQSKKVLRGCSVTFRGETVSINFIWRGQRQTKWISLKPSVVDLGVYWGYSQEHGVLTGCYITETSPPSRCLLLMHLRVEPRESFSSVLRERQEISLAQNSCEWSQQLRFKMTIKTHRTAHTEVGNTGCVLADQGLTSLEGGDMVKQLRALSWVPSTLER